MRLLQVTNIISHHQLPLARCIAAAVGGGNFRFAVTELPDPARQQLGWKSDEVDPWILRLAEEVTDRAEFEHWWDEADVVLCGERLLGLLNKRLAKGKLTFYMSERWGKPPIGMARLLHPRYALMALRFRRLALSPHFYYLPMGDYAATDMRWVARFNGRIRRWGYFTTKPDPFPSCDRSATGFRVLWAGRMLDWKRVDTLIQAFSQLLVDRPDATLTLVGDGPERNRLMQFAIKLLPTGTYLFIPSQPVAEIMSLMRQHHVYVLPSNAYEGWGAVINEALTEGCVVLASKEAGAAKTLIRHEENGLLFSSGDWQQLGKFLRMVARDEKKRQYLAQAGQKTLEESWTPQIAAERFLAVSKSLLNGLLPPSYIDGPMSVVK